MTNRMRVEADVTLLLGALLLLASCSASSKHFQGTQKSTASASSSPVTQTHELVVSEYFSLFDVPDAPIALLSVRLSNHEAPVYGDLVLEIENVSDKAIEHVEYGIGPSEQCGDYMYSTPPPSPAIGYGNAKAGGNEPALKPNEKAQITVASDKALQSLLNPKTYESCPAGHRKPQLMIQEVHFVDGAVWYPNQSWREKRFKS